ncbi:MAG: hypothetical protein E6R03_14890 [Hyphomicrobiaceae bacterium]|nr:MAG: hypothetical protein E6R03_14890 [Hyphomicrobiaceae bacterium]
MAIQTTLDMLNSEAEPAPPPPATPISADQDSALDDDVDTCPHPSSARLPARAMGHPKRFFCTECKETVE